MRTMASLTVRNIPEDAKLRFRQIAAAHGRSMEEHLRQLVLHAGTDVQENGQSTFQGVSDVRHDFKHQFDTPLDPKAASRARIERLIALGRGLNFEAPVREAEDIDIPEL
jgi:plasmid stability protein